MKSVRKNEKKEMEKIEKMKKNDFREKDGKNEIMKKCFTGWFLIKNEIKMV